MKVSVYVLSTLIAAASMLTAQSPTKVGIIHIQNAIVGTKEGQKAMQELEAKAGPKKQELERRQQEILAKQDQLNKMGNVGNDEQKAKLMRDIDQMKKAFTRDVDDAQADLDQENQRLMNTLGNRMLALLDKYAKDNGYALIIDVSNPQTSGVMFASTAIDVTQEMIKLFDSTPAGATTSSLAPAGTPARTAPAARPAGAVAKPGTAK